jgi:hypothetical protein
MFDWNAAGFVWFMPQQPTLWDYSIRYSALCPEEVIHLEERMHLSAFLVVSSLRAADLKD